MDAKQFIAIDFGAESGRLIVGEFKNDILKMDEIYRFPTQGTLLKGNLRWNVLRFWEEILKGLRVYREKYGSHADGIGVDSWGVSILALDEYDELCYTPFHYRADLIADPMLEKMKENIGEKFIFDLTGIQFMALNTSTHLYAMRHKFPHLLSRAKTLFMIPDYFYFLLTGKKITEYTNASTTQLLDVFKREWSSELLTKLNIDSKLFPPIFKPGFTLGALQPEICEQTKLESIPVHLIATHDTGSAIVGIPHTDSNVDWAYLSSGTWSLLGVEISEPIVNDAIAKYNLTNEGGVDGTIRLLKNIMGLWLLQECKRDWEKMGNLLDYAQITQQANDSIPFQHILYPDDSRFFSPKSMVEAISEYCRETSQSVPTTPGEFARCIFESLVCRYREILEILEELTGKSIQQIHIVGGGSKNQLLAQMTADITGKVVITGPVEATAIGNLLMQAKASGILNDLVAIRNVVKNSFPIEVLQPNLIQKSQWDAYYQKYLALPK